MEVAIVLFTALLPAAWFIRGEVHRRRDPAYLRTVGIIVMKSRVLDETADVIGQYQDRDIYRYVVFRGLRYDFSRIVPPAYKRVLKGRELYLEPGLVYVTG